MTEYYAPCVGSGFCCKKAPCPYGEADETGGCRFLIPWPDNDLGVPRYRCGKYEEISKSPTAHFSPAFGAGCSSTLFNQDRDRVLVALRSRGRMGAIS
jgi:hypothetical protein